MKKATFAATVLAAALATPALANDSNVSNAAFTAQLASEANAKQVRKLLAGKNYRNISELNLDENGRWTGTAVKDGKTIVVSVYLPVAPPSLATN